jgi:hypothetical protein
MNYCIEIKDVAKVVRENGNTVILDKDGNILVSIERSKAASQWHEDPDDPETDMRLKEWLQARIDFRLRRKEKQMRKAGTWPSNATSHLEKYYSKCVISIPRA